MQENILVSIRCLTYNHEAFIRQCLEGFIMQKTNFKFEAIIHDDASTDNSATIIKEYASKYPDIIKPILETENQYSKHDGSLSRIMNAAVASTAKYIAYCEGDDFWTDPYKLQKQVDILEANPQVTMVYTGFQTINDQGQTIIRPAYEKFPLYSKTGCLFKELLQSNFIMTLTVCIRKECLFSDIIQNAPSRLDHNLFLGAASMGDLYYLPEKTGCYRQTTTGATATQQKQIDNAIEKINTYYIIKFLTKKIKRHFTFKDNIHIRFIISSYFISLLLKRKKQLCKSIIKSDRYLYLFIIPGGIYKLVKKLQKALD